MSFLRYITERRFSLIEYVAISVCIALLGIDQWPWAFLILVSFGVLSGVLGSIAERRK